MNQWTPFVFWNTDSRISRRVRKVGLAANAVITGRVDSKSPSELWCTICPASQLPVLHTRTLGGNQYCFVMNSCFIKLTYSLGVRHGFFFFPCKRQENHPVLHSLKVTRKKKLVQSRWGTGNRRLLPSTEKNLVCFPKSCQFLPGYTRLKSTLEVAPCCM